MDNDVNEMEGDTTPPAPDRGPASERPEGAEVLKEDPTPESNDEKPTTEIPDGRVAVEEARLEANAEPRLLSNRTQLILRGVAWLITVVFVPLGIYWYIKWVEHPRLAIYGATGVVEWTSEVKDDTTFLYSTVRDHARQCTVWKGITALPPSISYKQCFDYRSEMGLILHNTGRVPITDIKLVIHSELPGVVRVDVTPNIAVQRDSSFGLGARQDALIIPLLPRGVRAAILYQVDIPVGALSSASSDKELRATVAGARELSPDQIIQGPAPLPAVYYLFEKERPLAGWPMPIDGFCMEFAKSSVGQEILFRIVEKEGHARWRQSSTCATYDDIIGLDSAIPEYLEVFPHKQ